MSERDIKPSDDDSDAKAADADPSDSPTEFHAPSDRSVMDSLGHTIGLDPRVSLRSGDELEGPVVRTNSNAIDTALPDASRYRLDGEIARGGMGAVLKGRDTDLGRDLAIKVLLGEHQDRPDVIQRFVEEAQIAGQLQHPGIVPVHELGQCKDGRPFFTMKLVKGKTLAALLAERGSPAEDRARFLGIFEQICQTMAYAHSRGVIHRDLKPANIMVGAFGEVQVMDWGLAKVLSEGGVADEKRANEVRPDVSMIQTIRSLGSSVPGSVGSLGSSSPTMVGSVMGTPAYMPPEQALGEVDQLSERSDVFALGAILCEIFTGQPPYVGKNQKEVYHNAARAKLDDCRDRLVTSEVDDELKQMCLECLQVEPKDRFRNAGILATHVEEYLASAEERLRQAQLDKVKADTQVVEERKRRFVMMGLAASILATVFVAGGGWVWLKQKDADLAKADSDAKLAAMEQRSKLAQDIGQELSTARALGNVESGELPDPQSLRRAVEAIERADSLLSDGEVDEALSSEVLQLHEQLDAAKRDHDFKLALNVAWERELEYRGLRNSSFATPTGSNIVPGKSDDATEYGARDAAHPRHAYESAFRDWGLEIDKVGPVAAASKLNSMPTGLQHLAFASLDRWRALLNEPTYFWQWQLCNWSTLDDVKLVSRDGDKFEVLEDGSILASGDDAYAGYDLEFETDCQELSALRLEAMLHESLPRNGPGRSELGEFGVYDLKVFWAPRSNPESKKRLRFREAVADYSWRSDEVTVSSWNITGGGGQEHAAVLEVEEPPQSPSGFRLWISHEDRPRGRWEDQNLGRFRWSATADANNDRRNRVRSRTIQAVVESADPNSWRNALRRELADKDVLALIRRASDHEGCASQPNGILVQLAYALRQVNGERLMDAVSKSINWQVLEPDELISEKGVTLTKHPDHSVVASGALPDDDKVTITSKLAAKRVSAIRIEFLPQLRSDGYPEKNLGRAGDLVLRECSVVAMGREPDGEAEQKTSIGVDFAFADYRWWTSVADAFDGDFETYLALTQRRQPRTIVVKLEPFDFSDQESLELNIISGLNISNTISGFRVSFTEDEFPVANVQATALNLLERMSQRDPSDYWTHLELARSYRKQIPPQLEDSMLHASAAVALQPDQLAAHDAMLRATPMLEARFDNRFGRIARRHLGEIRKRDDDHRIIGPIIGLAYRTASECAFDKDFEDAQSALNLAIELDRDTPLATPNHRLLNEIAWRLLIDPDNDPAEVAEFSVAMAKRALEIDPENADTANTLGVAYCRAENWPLALETLNQSVKLGGGDGVVVDWFGLAMAHWHLDNKDEAKRSFDKAISTMDEEDAADPMLKRVRQEVEELLGLEPAGDAASD